MENNKIPTSSSKESIVFLIVIISLFGYLGHIMGVDHLFNTIMYTAHDLLLNTSFFIMAIAVLAGALSALLSEFGVISLINKLISPIMAPLYDLPGAASLGAITTFLSDNPAVISLANDKGFIKYFEDYQVPALCNLGTSFGMGLILCTYMFSMGENGSFLKPVLIGFCGAFLGSIISVKLMLRYTKKHYGVSNEELKKIRAKSKNNPSNKIREIRQGTVFERTLDAMLDGGKVGVQLGLDIIPGVLVITTLVMVLTNGPSMVDGNPVYLGVAYEGVALLPKLGKLLSPILQPLFGFQNPVAIAFPITSLGSVGAAMGLVTPFLKDGFIGANEIAVFTAMGMCWSGYLSTHVSMMDALNVRFLTPKAILSHTIGGLCAGVFAHYLFVLSQIIS